MRVEKNLEKNKKIYVYLPLIILFLLIILFYTIIWFKIKSAIVSSLNSYNTRYEIKYDSVRVSGFPFIMKAHIKNLQIKLFTKSQGDGVFTIENLTLKNLIFTKNLSLVVNGKVFYGKKDDDVYFELNNESFDIVIGSDGSLKSIDAFIPKLLFHGTDSADINNLTFKMVTVTDYNYINRTFRFNVDQILYENNSSESNFEVIFSNIREMKDDRLISTKNVLDTFTFNDITNNFGIAISGQNTSSTYINTSPLNLDLEINNYNSLIAALNNEDSILIFDRNKTLNAIRFLSMLPEDNRSTSSKKYYKINLDLVKKTIEINGLNAKNILQKVVEESGIGEALR